MSKPLAFKSRAKMFVRRNANAITALLVVGIIVEGSVAWFYPSKWWQPLVAILVIAALVLAWRNLKAAIKLAVSLGLTVMLAALAIQSGFYLTGSSIGGTIWGLSVLSGWAVSVLTSYLVVSTRSRWGVALAATIAGYAMSYLFMEIGVIGVYLISVAVSLVVTLVMLKSDWLNRVSKRSPRLIGSWKHTRLDDAVRSLWPEGHEGRLKLSRKRSLPTWHGAGSPTIVFAPLDLDESLESTSKYGLTYHGRDVRRWLLWLTRKIDSKTLKPAPLVVLVDVNGANEGTVGKPEIIRVPDVDSVRAVYCGLMDGTGSRNELRAAVADVAKRFEGVEKADSKQESKLAKILDPKPAKTKKTKPASSASADSDADETATHVLIGSDCEATIAGSNAGETSSESAD